MSLYFAKERVRRFINDISPAELARERDRQEYLSKTVKGNKIYFRVVELDGVFVMRYIVFFTPGRIVEPPFLNREQKSVFEKTLKVTGKGYIQEVIEGKTNYKEIGSLDRCPTLPRNLLEKAIDLGHAVPLN